MSIDALYQELGREFAAGLDSATFIKPAGTARLGRGTDSGEVVVLPADRQYPTFPLFWVYRESGTTTSDPFQAVPWYPGLTYDNSQRHMEVVLVQFPQIDPKLHFIFSFTDIGLAAWGGATPAQVGLQQAAAVTPDKILTNSIYFSSGVTLGFRGGTMRLGDNIYHLPANTSFVDLTSYIPAVASTERWVNIAINSTGVAAVASSDTFADSETNKLNYVPNTVPSGHLHLGSVLLANGLATGTNDLILPFKDMFLAPSESSTAIVDLPVTVNDTELTIRDETDQTKSFQFQASGITTGQMRTLTVPDYDGTIATLTGTETLTNKTLTSPAINTPVIVGGTIDNAIIGGTTPAAGTFTTVTSTGNIVGTGLVQSQAAAATAFLRVTANAGQARVLDFMSSSSLRWRWNCTSTAESGSNAGSDLTLVRVADDGTTSLGVPISITRSSGAITFTGATSIVGTVTTTSNTALTNSTADVLTVKHNTSGTPATGFGSRVLVQGESSTTVDQSMFDYTTTWATATHASRKARTILNSWDTAARECIRLEASGTAAMLGFFGVAAVVRPSAYTPTNVTTDRSYDANATTTDELADVLGTLIADLQSLGLIS